MRILFLGDIVGKAGRLAVKQFLPKLREDLRLDAVFANAENIAGGIGITGETLDELFAAGVDFAALEILCHEGESIGKRAELRPMTITRSIQPVITEISEYTHASRKTGASCVRPIILKERQGEGIPCSL